MSRKSPFKFLDSYEKQDKDIFFGREKETEELYHKVFESKLLLIYGVSGTGKTSIINCGLANKFEDSDWLPVSVRRGRNIVVSLIRELKKVSLSRDMNEEGRRDMAEGNEMQNKILKLIRSVYLDHFKPVYLIFDQFEEIFIGGSREERSELIQIIKSIVDSDLQCRLIISMREEYIAGLTEFEDMIPGILDNKYRIERMTRKNALEVIKGPCKTNNIETENNFAEKLLERLNPGSNEVELTYLQVYLDRIFNHASGRKPEGKANIQFKINDLKSAGDVSDLLGNFLEEQVSKTKDPEASLTILKSFVSLKGTKKHLDISEIAEAVKRLGRKIPDNEIEKLVKEFVDLRILTEKDDNSRYELRHDSLATKIFEKLSVYEKELLEVRQFLDNACEQYDKRNVLLTSNDLKYISDYEDKLLLDDKAKKLIKISSNALARHKKRIKAIALTGFIAIIIITAGSILQIFRLPYTPITIFLGSIVYFGGFLPLFFYYIFKTKENRTINILFLLFTLVLLGTVFLYNTSVKNILLKPVVVNEQKLMNTLYNLSLKNKGIIEDIRSINENQHGRLDALMMKADSVSERTLKVQNYIESIKLQIISLTENTSVDEIVEGDNIPEYRMRRLDATNVPKEILIGQDNKGKAYELKKRLEEYMTLLNKTADDNPVITKSISTIIDIKDPEIAEGAYTWEEYNFEGMPLGFVVNTLTEIQTDIRYAESEILSFLLEQSRLSVTETGRNLPSVVVSPMKMNVLYNGVQNPVEIMVPGGQDVSIIASVTNGNIKRMGDHYIITPVSAGNCDVNVTAERKGERMSFAPIRFRVKNVPEPEPSVAGHKGGLIKKDDLLRANGVKASISSEFEFDIEFIVTKFTLVIRRSPFMLTETSNSNRFTNSQKNLISDLEKDDFVWLTDIKVVGPDGVQRYINDIIFIIAF